MIIIFMNKLLTKDPTETLNNEIKKFLKEHGMLLLLKNLPDKCINMLTS